MSVILSDVAFVPGFFHLAFFLRFFFFFKFLVFKLTLCVHDVCLSAGTGMPPHVCGDHGTAL